MWESTSSEIKVYILTEQSKYEEIKVQLGVKLV